MPFPKHAMHFFIIYVETISFLVAEVIRKTGRQERNNAQTLQGTRKHTECLGRFFNLYYLHRHGCTSHMNSALMVSTCSAFRLLGSVFM